VRGGTLVVALRADIDSWNPYTTHDATAANILDLLYPRLLLETSSDREGSSFEPWLAGSWGFSPDRLRLTFHLVEGAQWSNGVPVTCEDVRFTYRAQMAEELAWPGTFIKNRIEGIDCPADRTAVFRFTEAYPDQLLDANDNAIVPAVYGEIPFDEWASTSWENRSVTSGPYRLSGVRPGQEAVLERDPGWWRAPGSYVDRVILRVYPEASGVMPRFLEGEVDLLAKVPALRAQEVEARPDLRLVELPSLSYTYLGWNVLEPEAYLEDRRARNCGDEPRCREDVADIRRLQRERPHPILADPEVRKALTLAIDREDLVLGLWAGHARVGTSPIVSALWAHDPSTALPLDYDRAAALLENAGWSDLDRDGTRERDGRPLKLTVIVNSENRVRRDALERVVANLSRIGVDLDPEPLPRGEFVARARDKDFDVVLSGWWAGTRIQPQNHLHTRAAIQRGNNLVSWSTSASDELLDRAAAATEREEALPLWREWQQEFKNAQPITILYEERGLIGMNGRVRGPAPPFLDPYQRLPEWWLADGN
jgi:peptide/nickel transport system substrate-binding protein